MADDERKRIEEARKAKRAKQAEIDRKRAEVRKRMEEASKAKKAKKGFMTPDRKKKLRLLLRKKAAEELKKEQERKAAERRRIIEERCGTPKDVDNASEEDLAEIITELWNRWFVLEGEKFDLEREFRMKAFEQLKAIIKQYYDRMIKCENQKWDLEYEVRKRDMEIADLNSQVNDLRGKFVKPTLKKVSKYENKFAKLQKKAAEFNFRNQLKVVKKKEFTLEEEDKEKKPDWSKKGDEKKGEEESDDESCATHDDTATVGDSEHTDADTKSDAGLSEGSLRGTPEPATILEEPPVIEEPEPEPEPPSPAPEELWEYLKEIITHDSVISVDELKEKLVTTVTAIPEPYLKSVVKESIKKQKSIEEEEPHPDGVPAENADPNAPPAEGDPSVAPSSGEAPAEGAATDSPPAEGAPAEGAPPAEGAESAPEAAPPAEPSATESAPEPAPAEPAPAEPAPAVEAQPPMVEAAA